MREPLADGRLAPGEIELALRRAARDGRGVLDEALSRILTAVEEDVLDPLEQIGLDVLVHGELAGVDDSHVEACADRVVEERGVHRLADGVVSAEREGEVRDPSRDERARAALLQERDRVDERLRERRVLLDARGDGEDVRVEHDILGREPGIVDEQVVRAPEDLDLPLDRVRLPALVERHDDGSGAERADRARLLEERLLALLERDGVHDALALEAAQSGLQRREARAVDHDRQARRFRLGGEEVEERRHRLLRVEQVGVHVDVEQVRAATHLLERDVDRALEVVRLDQPPELRRAGHVRPLADDDEPGVGTDDERLETREARQARALGHPPRRKPLDGTNDRVRVLGRRPATASDEVHETVLGERAQVPARIGRLLVVEAEGVRQARVGMTRHVRRRDARHPFEEGPHLGRTERAVDPDDERLGVLDGDPERVRRLAREVAPAPVDRREGEPERELGRSRSAQRRSPPSR